MITDLFRLKDLKPLHLDQRRLTQEMEALSRVTAAWEGYGSLESRDLIEELRQRVRTGYANQKKFSDYTSVKRREALLLALYLTDLGEESARASIPSFDEKVATSIFGKNPEAVKKHLRRLGTQLYFVHYDEVRNPCLAWLASFLKIAWKAAAGDNSLDAASKVWAEHAEILFGTNAHDKVAAEWRRHQPVQELADQFYIHEGSLFRNRLLEALILRRLRETPVSGIDPELDQLVTEEKERTLATGYALGAEAVRILVTRSMQESSTQVPKAWRAQLVSYACDPRITNRLDQARWWGWASPKEKDIAIRALSELSLLEFIKLLEKSLKGTSSQHQFSARRDFLLRLFEMGKVIEARLIVHHDLYRRMHQKTRELHRASWVSGKDTSFICLRCSNDVFLIEGTHSFGLRGFLGKKDFPISNFWNADPSPYLDSQFRVPANIYQAHMGAWVEKFQSQLKYLGVHWDPI